MSDNVKLHAWLTSDTLDVFADISNFQRKSEKVMWRFVMPDGIRLMHRNRLEGEIVLMPGRLDRVGVSICRTSLEPISEAGLKELRIEVTVIDDTREDEPLSYVDIKTIGQVIETAKFARSPKR